MPRAIKAGSKHRIPVENDELFEEVRTFAMKRNMTWVEYVRYTLDMTRQYEAKVKRSTVRQPAPNGKPGEDGEG